MDCIDLFSGAGGLTSGLHAAGFNTIAAIEMDRDCCYTYSSAFPEVDLKQDSIQNINFSEYMGIDLVAGGPPCQPFSSGGKRLANRDERDMLPEFVRAIREAKPRAFLMENVAGLGGATHNDYFSYIRSSLEDLGYTISHRILNAADYGVPQKRRRFFVVGVRDGDFEFPYPTHGPSGEMPYVSAGNFIDKNKIKGEANPSKVIYARNPDLRPSPYDGHLFNGGGRAIDLNSPSHTILASAGGNKTHFIDSQDRVPPYHAHLCKGGKPRTGCMEGGRRLTVFESALLQTFDPEIKFYGSRSSQYTQVGNAVPPLLATVLGKALIGFLEN